MKAGKPLMRSQGHGVKSRCFPNQAEWEGQFYEEKEVTVYYKVSEEEGIILLTVKARYGEDFPRRNSDEDRI